MTVYAKMKGNALVLPTSYPAANPLGSLYTDSTNSNALTFRDYAGIDTPIFGGTLTPSEIFTKRKKNGTGSTLPVNTTVALKSDGTICLAESDVTSATTVLGTTLEPISSGTYGAIRLVGSSNPNVVSGMGFTSGDIIYLGSTGGALTNDLGSVIGTVRVVGIADCETDTQSSIATDLILVVAGSGGGGGSGGSVQVTVATTILRGTPVSINALGSLVAVDITDEDSAYAFCGIASVDTLVGGSANVLTAGSVLYDIPAVYGLTGQWGKPIFVSHTGDLTMVKPEIGVGGFLSLDFIVSVGVTTKNTSTGTTDLILNPRIVGRLA
jgi:hypothetical protein